MMLVAQKNFKPGYLITNSQDTISGLIKSKSDVGSARVCIFKRNENAREEKYEPYDILGYRFDDGKYFITMDIPVGDVKQRQFVEYLINGIVDVYYYASPEGERYFIEKEGTGELVELTNELVEAHAVSRLNNESTYLKNSNRYIGNLKLMMVDAPGLQNRIETATLDRKSLVNLSKNYHDLVCTDGDCIIYEKRFPRPVLEAGAVVAFTDIELTGFNNHDNIATVSFNYPYYSDWKPAMGLYLKANYPKSRPAFYARYEALFVRHVLSSNYHRFGSGTDTVVAFKVKSLALRNSVAAGIYLSDWKIRPQLELGFYVNVPLKTQFTGLELYNARWLQDPFKNVATSGINASAGFAIKLPSDRFVNLVAEYSHGFNLFSNYYYNEWFLKLSIPIIGLN